MPRQARTTLELITESEWQQTVVDYANSQGWLVYHPYDSRRSKEGYPDLTLVRERIVFAELKREAGVLSRAQAGWAIAIRKAGSEYHIWRPSDWEEVQRVLGSVIYAKDVR